MKYFAKINSNGIVEKVEVVLDTVATNEQAGINFLNNQYSTNDNWKQTYPDKSFRKNFACVGDVYDNARDAFYEQQPYNSWTLNEETCEWQAPVEYPITYTDGVQDNYVWNETNQNWVLA